MALKSQAYNEVYLVKHFDINVLWGFHRLQEIIELLKCCRLPKQDIQYSKVHLLETTLGINSRCP